MAGEAHDVSKIVKDLVNDRILVKSDYKDACSRDRYERRMLKNEDPSPRDNLPREVTRKLDLTSLIIRHEFSLVSIGLGGAYLKLWMDYPTVRTRESCRNSELTSSSQLTPRNKVAFAPP